MKNPVVRLIALGLLLIFAVKLSWYWIKWGPRPDIHVQGQVIDRANGHGVSDAYVILAVRVSKSSFGGTNSGCSAGSAVVRTDKDGKFNYSITAREAFGPENPSSWGVRIYVYHPEFDAALDRDLPLVTEQRLAASRTPDGGWQERPSDSYLTFPYFYDDDKDEDGATIEVVKRGGSEWQQIEYFVSSPHYKCIEAPVDRGHSQLLTELHRRTWAMLCLENTGAERNRSPRTLEVRGRFFAPLEQAYFAATRKSMGYAGVQQFSSQQGSLEKNSVFADYPWDEKSPEFNRDMTEKELAAFCQFHTPPVEDVVNRSLSQ